MIPNKTDFETEVSLETEAVPIPDDPPFHILFLGDYSGRENLSFSTEAKLPVSAPIEIDRDNFTDVLKKLNTSLRLDLQGNGKDLLFLNFRQLDDFHPDRLFEQVPLFSELREMRKRLVNHDTFEQTAVEVRSWFEINEEEPTENVIDQTSAETTPESSGNLLDDILTNKVADADSYPSETTRSPELNKFIRDVVRPHLIHTDENEQERLLSYVDEAISELMRKILHHPQFQALESAWRGLYFVVRRTETSNDLKLFLMDISKAEIIANLKSSDDLSDTDIYRKVFADRDTTISNEPWSLICGNYTFALNVEDTASLMRLAKIGNISNAPFISQIKPNMLGIESIADQPRMSDWDITTDSSEAKLWTMLRTIPEAGNLGFIIPGLLIRLPYGKDSEPTEVFSFEEFTVKFDHENYVWINSSFAIALLFAQSYRSFAWDMGHSLFQELEGFPVHLYPAEDGVQTKAPTEIYLSHQSCDCLIEQGLMPLISFRDTDRIRLGIFQSIAFPPKSLTGRWN